MSRSGSIHELENETTKTVSTSALKARFEEKASEEATPVKRNFVIKGKAGEISKKFNQGVSTSTKCLVCSTNVYPMEKLEVEGQLYHKICFKCETCKRTLGLGNYASLQGKFYCKPHLKQLFQLKGNYDEGFGREQRKADWMKKGGDEPPQSSTIAESTQEQNIVSKDVNGVNGHANEVEDENSDDDSIQNGNESGDK